MSFVASAEVKLSGKGAWCCYTVNDEEATARQGEMGHRALGDNNVVVDDTEIVIQGELEYWARGDNYRINSHMDPATYPGMDTQIAYNGREFQLLRPSASTLTYSSQDSAVIVMGLTNPLLQLVQFRYPVTDENFEFRLRLKDIRNDRIPDGFWKVGWVTVKEDGQVLERAEFPGGIYEGQKYVHYVYAVRGARNQPLRIDRVTDEGKRLTSTEFSDYFEVSTAEGSTFWPRSVALRAFDGEGNQVINMSYIITDFSVNAEIGSEIFTISKEQVERVWDDDQAVFVKSRPAARSRQ